MCLGLWLISLHLLTSLESFRVFSSGTVMGWGGDTQLFMELERRAPVCSNRKDFRVALSGANVMKCIYVYIFNVFEIFKTCIYTQKILPNNILLYIKNFTGIESLQQPCEADNAPIL